ncbi:uncharacterized protein LOC133185129 [Saccostrea echinata]|uniref:uncharacterized protein LOC133185129 n=1 Tax=Saccostrea echinata TaxID=191078 RepID=UPI002A802624|nr:uncharacterized protein LOC133185129 [Saccostrea echinata]
MATDTKRVVVGVDVGGTNTDAVILDIDTNPFKVLTSFKTQTTHDVTSGVRNAVVSVINKALEISPIALTQINIGTTHFVNAVLQRKGLVKVGVIRLCGPASRNIPPFSDIPEDLRKIVYGGVCMANGGYEFDGREISPVDKNEIIDFLKKMYSIGVRNIVVAGIFSPVCVDQENLIYTFIKEYNPNISVTLSHHIGQIGLLQRENAAILNETLKPLCKGTVERFNTAISEIGITCPFFLTKNDGTIIEKSMAMKFPITTFSCGPTNSMRGAAYLSGLKNAIVVDIGGTTTDVGLITKGFPKLSSSEIRIGGIRTNFHMPDVRSIGLGGGSYVRQEGEEIVVGPESAGYRILEESLVFANQDDISDKKITATDISVAANISKVGTPRNVEHLPKKFIEKSVEAIKRKIEECIDETKITSEDFPVILVGGGHILVDKKQKMTGVSEIIIPEYSEVANAIGAALSQVAGNVEYVKSLDDHINKVEKDRMMLEALKNDMTGEEKERVEMDIRKRFYEEAHKNLLDEARKLSIANAIEKGAEEKSIFVLEEGDIPLSYLPGNASKFFVKTIGNIDMKSRPVSLVLRKLEQRNMPASYEEYAKGNKEQNSSTNTLLAGKNENKCKAETPFVNTAGEWILNEFDVECITIGAGILGSGGGGSPYIGKLRALNSLREGKQIKIVNPLKIMENADDRNDLVVIVASMGAPLIAEEKLLGKESQDALKCMADLYSAGYCNGEIPEDIDVIKEENITYINDFKCNEKNEILSKYMGQKRIVGVMSAEIGGINSVEPFTVAAEMNLPVLDCDGMGRAFPELQMLTPLIYGMLPYPSTLADAKGRRAVVLKANSAKDLENHFRKVVVEMGCMAGVVISSLQKDDVLKKTVLFTTSLAWKIGRAVINARNMKLSTTDAVLGVTGGRILIGGKIVGVKRETTGGFNIGYVTITSFNSDDVLKVEFQNENVVATLTSADKEQVVATVPDLITIVDTDTGEPVPTEALRYGLRVTVLVLPAHEKLKTAEALKFVGPKAFGYNSLTYRPCCDSVSTNSLV